MAGAAFFAEQLAGLEKVKEYRDPELPSLLARTVSPDETVIRVDWPTFHPGDTHRYYAVAVITDRRFILFFCAGGGWFGSGTWRLGRTIAWYQVTEVRARTDHPMMLEIHTAAAGDPLLMGFPTESRDAWANFLAEVAAKHRR